MKQVQRHSREKIPWSILRKALILYAAYYLQANLMKFLDNLFNTSSVTVTVTDQANSKVPNLVLCEHKKIRLYVTKEPLQSRSRSTARNGFRDGKQR